MRMSSKVSLLKTDGVLALADRTKELKNCVVSFHTPAAM